MHAYSTATANTAAQTAAKTAAMSIRSTQVSVASSLVAAGHAAGFGILSRSGAGAVHTTEATEATEATGTKARILNKPDAVWNSTQMRACFRKGGGLRIRREQAITSLFD